MIPLSFANNSSERAPLSIGFCAINAPMACSTLSSGGHSSIGAPISDSASRPKIPTADRQAWLCSLSKHCATPPTWKPLSAIPRGPKHIAPPPIAPSPASKNSAGTREYALFADTPAQKHFSQHANILAVWLDVVPRAQQQELLTRILSATDQSFHTDRKIPPMTAATYYFRFYLARAIEHAGLGDRYLDLLGPWHTMVSLGLTTWAEQPEPTRSDSHAWSAHPNYDLLRIVAGIRPAKPGFASVSIEPHLGTLKHVQASEPHPSGPIDVEFTRTTDRVNARIVLPSGLPGDLIWQGKTYPLHAGEQTLSLPAR